MTEADGMFTDGEAYERMMGRWSRLVGRTFLDWLDVPKGLRWLDVGCGNGAFTEELVARAQPAAVAAIDPSEGQIAYARKRHAAGMAEFQVADAQALPFVDGSFDAATMALVISFVPDPAKAVAEMARVVRPGGYVATYMWDLPGNGAPLALATAALRSLGETPPGPPSPQASRLEVMQNLWQAARIEAIETRVISIPVSYSGFDDFWASHDMPVGPLGNFISRMPPAAKEKVRARLREQVPTAPDGRIAYEAHANAVKGRVPT